MLKRLKPKSEFTKNVLTLMTGSIVAQAIPMAISPVLTRLYTPEDFGVFSLYMSLVSLLSLIATFRYEMAIVLPKKHEDALQIVMLSSFIVIILAILICIVVFLFNKEIIDLLGNDQISNLLYFIPFSFFFIGIYQILNYWNVRNNNYKLLSKNKIIQSSTSATSNVLIGLSHSGINGLVISTLISQFFATLLLLKNFIATEKNIYIKINKIKLYGYMRKYKKLPLLNMPNAFIDGMRVSGINIIISHLFSATLLGYYTLAFRMTQMPLSLIGGSLSTVLYSKIAKTNKKDLFNIVTKSIIKFALLPLIPFLILYIFSVDIFTFIFGENWRISGEITRILVPWLYLNFITSPISTIFIVLNKQEVLLIFSIIYMLVPILIFYFFSMENFLDVLNYVSLSMSSLLLVFILLVLFYTKQESL